MARLFIANCRGQHRVINYRLDYTVDDQGRRTSERLVPYKTQTVAARQQMQFGSDWHPVQLTDIIQQLEESCGAVHVDAVRTAKKMGVVNIIWQQDKPITAAVLRDVVDHNMGLLSEQGSERRARLALGADMNLETITGQEPQRLEMELEQIGDDPDSPTAPLVERLRVNHDASRPAAPPKRAAARRKAA